MIDTKLHHKEFLLLSQGDLIANRDNAIGYMKFLSRSDFIQCYNFKLFQ